MSEPIKSKRLNDLASAPTPQNTPATAASSFATRLGTSQPRVPTIAEESDGAKGGAQFQDTLALLQSIQGNLNHLVGKSSGYIESLPKKVQDRILGLKTLQSEHSKLEAQFHQELLQLERKYLKLYEPNYIRRAAIINGQEEPTAEEVEFGKAIKAEELDEDEEQDAQDEDEDEDEAEGEDEDEEVTGIPNFWLTALTNIAPLADTITERDTEALTHLVDISLKYLETPGFALEFHFSENEFFTNKVLTKTYYYQEETGYGGDYIYDHADGDDIKWTSPENNLTIRVEKRKQRNKHTKATRTIEKLIPTESFFSFFDPPHMPQGDEEEEDELDEIELADLESRLELDYEFGEEIKDKLIPRAIDWFTGDALEYEGLSEGEEFEDEEEEEEEEEDSDAVDEDDDDDVDDDDGDDEEDDEDEDDSEDESNSRPAAGKSKSKSKAKVSAKAPLAPGQQPPDCKQS